MKNIYVVYEIVSKDFQMLNNYNSICNVLKIFDNEDKALNYVNNELSFQCNDNEGWFYNTKIMDDMEINSVYYNEDWHYDIVLQEMKVE